MLNAVLNKMEKGWEIKEICIDNDIFSGKEITDITVNFNSNYVCIELIYDELLYTQLNKINWVMLEDD